MILPSRLSHFPLNKGHEGIPIPVHLDASKLKECLCPFLDPTHASVVQALVDHMLDRPLDRAGGQCLGLSTAPRRKGVDLSGAFARMQRCARSTAGSARPPPSRALPAGKFARSNVFLQILDMSQDLPADFGFAAFRGEFGPPSTGRRTKEHRKEPACLHRSRVW